MPAPSSLQSRFEDLTPLGRGGAGTVYRAFDRRRGIELAVKTLNHAAPHELAAFKREFRLIADISHPNLVQLYDLFHMDDQWWLAMELVHGQQLGTWLRGEAAPQSPRTAAQTGGWLWDDEPTGEPDPLPADTVPAATSPGAEPPPPMDWDRFKHTLPQLADAIAALHAAGRLHLDVKPANVLVTPEGRVVLVDFGLAHRIGTAGPSMVSGTPTYMAPEQAAGGHLDTATDWYAFGAVLYELLGGRPPFLGSTARILHDKQFCTPPPLQVADAPPGWVELAQALLDRDPACRPTQERIRAVLGGWTQPSRRAPATPARRAFVGRDDELSLLAARHAQAAQGERVVVAIQAPSGVGKTTLVQSFLASLGEDSPALSTRCYQGDHTPFKALDGWATTLVRRHVDALDLSTVEWSVLTSVFPGLGTTGSDAARGLSERDRLRLLTRVLDKTIDAAVSSGPLIVWLDDVQWVDEDSVVVLAHALRRPGVTWLLTLRPEGLQPSSPASPLVSLATDNLQLRPLSPAQSLALSRQLLPPHARDAAARVAAEADGQPFLIEAICEHLASSDDPDAIDMAGVIDARLQGLSDAERSLLIHVAIAARPTPLRLLGQAAGQLDQCWRAAARLQSLGLLAMQAPGVDDTVACRHDRIREAASTLPPPDHARQVHLRLAEVYEREGVDAGTTARHYLAARRPDRARPLARAAARAAEDALAFERATEWYTTLLELSVDSEERRATLVDLGRALLSTGRGADAAERWLQAAEMGGPGSDGLRIQAAEELGRSGYLQRSGALMAAALSDMGEALPRARVAQILSLVWNRLFLSPGAIARRVSCVPQVRDGDAEPPQLSALWAVAHGRGMHDPLASTLLVARLLRLGLSAGCGISIARALSGLAISVGVRGPHATSRAGRLLDLASQVDGRAQNHARVALCRAICAFQIGAFDDARRHARAGLEIALDTPGCSWELRNCRFYLADCDWATGDLERGRASYREQIEEAEAVGDLHTRTLWTLARPFLFELLDDDVDAALSSTDRALAGWRPEVVDLNTAYASFQRAQVHLYRGDVDAAAKALRGPRTGMRLAGLFTMYIVRVRTLEFEGRIALGAGQGRRAL
ncbi:MAG: hypothetical protein D6798_12920, partial [Deltaproteobacteria bacterium]